MTDLIKQHIWDRYKMLEYFDSVDLFIILLCSKLAARVTMYVLFQMWLVLMQIDLIICINIFKNLHQVGCFASSGFRFTFSGSLMFNAASLNSSMKSFLNMNIWNIKSHYILASFVCKMLLLITSTFN